jgi:hypothetical protein
MRMTLFSRIRTDDIGIVRGADTRNGSGDDTLNALRRCQSFAVHLLKNIATLSIINNKSLRLNRQGLHRFAFVAPRVMGHDSTSLRVLKPS